MTQCNAAVRYKNFEIVSWKHRLPRQDAKNTNDCRSSKLRWGRGASFVSGKSWLCSQRVDLDNVQVLHLGSIILQSNRKRKGSSFYRFLKNKRKLDSSVFCSKIVVNSSNMCLNMWRSIHSAIVAGAFNNRMKLDV